MEVIVAFCFGLVFGSFFNVVIYRLPLGKSIIRPGSSCPKCGHELSAFELIPIFSFLIQGRKCVVCREPISWRYPLVELISGLGFAFVTFRSNSSEEILVGLVFFSLLLILGLIDLDHKILPNVLTLSGMVIGLLFAFLGWTIGLGQAVLGLVVGFGVVFLIALLSRGGMGMGDVKLLGFIGAFLGWKLSLVTLFLAAFFGMIAGFIYLKKTGQDRKTPIPFGPFLALAALILYFI